MLNFDDCPIRYFIPTCWRVQANIWKQRLLALPHCLSASSNLTVGRIEVEFEYFCLLGHDAMWVGTRVPPLKDNIPVHLEDVALCYTQVSVTYNKYEDLNFDTGQYCETLLTYSDLAYSRTSVVVAVRDIIYRNEKSYLGCVDSSEILILFSVHFSRNSEGF